jgi:hypothetical protein
MSPALRGTFRAGKMYAFARPALPQSACKVPLHKPCGNLPRPDRSLSVRGHRPESSACPDGRR